MASLKFWGDDAATNVSFCGTIFHHAVQHNAMLRIPNLSWLAASAMVAKPVLCPAVSQGAICNGDVRERQTFAAGGCCKAEKEQHWLFQVRLMLFILDFVASCANCCSRCRCDTGDKELQMSSSHLLARPLYPFMRHCAGDAS